jgi:hypothetical protein
MALRGVKRLSEDSDKSRGSRSRMERFDNLMVHARVHVHAQPYSHAEFSLIGTRYLNMVSGTDGH